jgi:hypothetical protein
MSKTSTYFRGEEATSSAGDEIAASTGRIKDAET